MRALSGNRVAAGLPATKTGGMNNRHRLPAEIITHAVWLYRVFSLSLRDVELLLAERGIVISSDMVRCYSNKCDERFANRLRRRRPGNRDR